MLAELEGDRSVDMEFELEADTSPDATAAKLRSFTPGEETASACIELTELTLHLSRGDQETARPIAIRGDEVGFPLGPAVSGNTENIETLVLARDATHAIGLLNGGREVTVYIDHHGPVILEDVQSGDCAIAAPVYLETWEEADTSGLDEPSVNVRVVRNRSTA